MKSLSFLIAALAALAASLPALATDVTVIGLFPNMAVVTIDREPRSNSDINGEQRGHRSAS